MLHLGTYKNACYMLKKISVLTLLMLSVAFSSCRKDADKEKPFLVSATLDLSGTLNFEWDGVEGAQHTIVVTGEQLDPEVHEIAFNKFYEGYQDISKYSKTWVYVPGVEDGKWTMYPETYTVKVIANYDDGENVESNTRSVFFITAP